MVELAREVGGEDHGFRFIQLPFNLAMPEATTIANETLDGERVTVVEAAKRLGVTVVASASLLQGRHSIRKRAIAIRSFQPGNHDGACRNEPRRTRRRKPCVTEVEPVA